MKKTNLLFKIFLSLTLLMTIGFSGLYANEAVFNYNSAMSAQEIAKLKNNLFAQTPESSRSELYTYIVFLKNSDPEKIKRTIKEIYPSVLVSADHRTRALTFKTDKNTFRKVNLLIRKLDKTLSQIKLEVKIIEISYYNLKQYKNIFSDILSGFKINYDFKKQQIIPAHNLEGTLIRLADSGNAKILAKPTIATLDNHTAVIKIGDRIPYLKVYVSQTTEEKEVNYLDTGIELSILPKITRNNKIIVDINASISSVKLWKEFGNISYPILSTRQARTKVEIENKKTLVIAGLFDDQKKENISEIPFFADLPLVGALFKAQKQNKDQTDIVFLIPPEIF